jgi:Domain of unknown function (DUF6285)
VSIPSQAALLEVALQYLEGELLPTLAGEHRFKTRVAINALRIAQREASSESSTDAAIVPGLSNEQLAQKIRTDEIPLSDTALKAQLTQSLEQALLINNPKWLKRK